MTKQSSPCCTLEDTITTIVMAVLVGLIFAAGVWLGRRHVAAPTGYWRMYDYVEHREVDVPLTSHDGHLELDVDADATNEVVIWCE